MEGMSILSLLATIQHKLFSLITPLQHQSSQTCSFSFFFYALVVAKESLFGNVRESAASWAAH